MSPRKSYKTVNIPLDVAKYLDQTLAAKPLGIQSRDEFVRIAIAILGLAIQPGPNGSTALDAVQEAAKTLQGTRENSPENSKDSRTA